MNLLKTGRVFAPPFVIGELDLCNLRQCDVILDTLNNMPRVKITTDKEALTFINQSKLFELGVSYIDAHLLTSMHLTLGILLWAQNKRLRTAANRLVLLAALRH